MSLSINNPEIEALARELAKKTGETVDDTVARALRERLDRLRKDPTTRQLIDDLNEIALRCAALPDLDTRSPDEIIGYDENGLPR